MLIWPRSTLKSCGSSSIDVRRISLPMPVRRSVPSTPPGAVSPGRKTETVSGGGPSRHPDAAGSGVAGQEDGDVVGRRLVRQPHRAELEKVEVAPVAADAA